MNFITKSKIGPTVITVLAIIPILLIYPYLSFSTFTLLLLSLGQVSAVAGITLYSINFILSLRLKEFEPYFGGLNRMYIVHHISGGIAFLLILLHPIFIAWSYISISMEVAIEVLWPGISNLAITFGELALLVTSIVLIITLYIKLEYNLWKSIHKYLGLALLFVFIHVVFTGSLMQSIPVLKYYILTFLVSAIFSFIYRTLLGRFLIKKAEFNVVKVNRLNTNVTELSFMPVNNSFTYDAGQFVFLEFRLPGVLKESHPFSLLSKSDSLPIMIAVKSEGEYTNEIKNIKVGSKLLIEGPFGMFSYAFHPLKNQIWIAGGIGITPFVGMAQSLKPEDGINVHLFYSVKEESEAIYTDVFKRLAKTNPSFKYTLHISDKSGRIDAHIIKKTLGGIAKQSVFICGPSRMMKSLREQFVKEGIKSQKIYSEEFSLN